MPIDIEIDPLDRPVWGFIGIGRVINASPKKTEHLLRAGVIDADKLGRLWVSTPRRLLRQFAGVPAE